METFHLLSVEIIKCPFLSEGHFRWGAACEEQQAGGPGTLEEQEGGGPMRGGEAVGLLEGKGLGRRASHTL